MPIPQQHTDTDTLELFVAADGSARCLYGETINLTALGSLRIERASHVEPDDRGRWTVDLSPVGGPLLGPYAVRSMALSVEAEWLLRHRLRKEVGALAEARRSEGDRCDRHLSSRKEPT